MSCSGETTWCGFTRAILDKARVEPRPALVPIRTEEYPTAARRPRNSVLSNNKLKETFDLALPHWESALEACLRGD